MCMCVCVCVYACCPRMYQFSWQAIDCFKLALTRSQQAVTYVHMGRAHLLKNDIEGAISVYEEAVQ